MRFEGKTETDVIAKLGVPDYQKTYELVFPTAGSLGPVPSCDESGRIKIKTLRWDYRRHHVGVYLRPQGAEWVVRSAVKWKRGALLDGLMQKYFP